MLHRIVLAVSLSLACVSYGQTTKPAAVEGPQLKEGAPENVKVFWAKWLAERQERIAAMERQIQQDEETLKNNPPGTDRTTAQMRMRRARERLTEAKAETPSLPEVSELKSYTPGSIGYLCDRRHVAMSMTITQVIDAHSALITISFATAPRVRVAANGQAFPDEGTHYQAGPLWIATDTTGWVDDSLVPDEVSRIRIWQVTGTHQYQTVLGAPKTVPVIEPLDLERYLPTPSPAKPAEKTKPGRK